MSNKMIECKSCGQQIAKSAKTCPHCGAKNKKGHPILIGVLVFFILAGIVGAMGGSEEPQKVNNSATNQVKANTAAKEETKAAEKPEKNEFGVGETAELKGVSVTMVSVTESTGSQFNQPTEGNVFVICEFEIANNSNSEINVSSMMSFEAYCDDYTCTLSLGALMEKGNKNQLDGTVAAGKKFNGVIGYEVPSDWKELEVKFTPNFWSGRDMTFVATK